MKQCLHSNSNAMKHSNGSDLQTQVSLLTLNARVLSCVSKLSSAAVGEEFTRNISSPSFTN